ncbi:hypothetical protein OZ10_12645 [Xanthomonas cannabis pv. cannabis]|nr:hypothetical protein OZ10_12645 [Xanthomonas cannabis pv. cannabis]
MNADASHLFARTAYARLHLLQLQLQSQLHHPAAAKHRPCLARVKRKPAPFVRPMHCIGANQDPFR